MSDEPIFEAEETGLWSATGGSSMPDMFRYMGSVAQGDISSDMPAIYLDSEVAAKLQSEGQRSIKIDKEVAGILLGTRSADNQFIRVSHIAIAKDEDSSPVHFKFTYSVWDDLIDQMETLSRDAGKELLLVAWYHTHPNMSVFLSRYDLRTHRDFHRPYQFALVLAPQRGTEHTSVGFFCNRGEGTPLLPGLRLYGGQEEYLPPWKFETEPNEDFEEGEGDEEEGDARSSAGSVVHQLGIPGRDNPDWLTLGEDPVEGAVLAILEGMTSSVVGAEHDRIGVLLGTETEDGQVNITRVRFLGRTSADLELERGELLGALRFMADAFPATAEPKILGIVRIVAPRRLGVGSRFDPEEHNLGIAELLAEVGYDVRAVPFQVGLVLMPGILADRLLFQVFAQRRGRSAVHMNSFRALAGAARRPSSYYEAVGRSVLVVDQTPTLLLPAGMSKGTGAAQENLADTLRQSVEAMVPTPDTETDRLLKPSPMLASASADEVTDGMGSEGSADGIDWDRMAAEEAPRRGLFGRASTIGLFLLALIVGGALILNFATRETKQTVGGSEPLVEEEDSARGAESNTSMSSSDPYEITVLGCRGGFCSPFPDDAPHVRSVDLVRVVRRAAYLEKSLKPIEVWLERLGQGGRRVRLGRRAEGQDTRVFEVRRRGSDWSAFWGDGGAFDARMVVLPQGTPLDGQADSLRVEREIRLRGPLQAPEDELEPDSQETQEEERAAPVALSRGWNWRGSGDTLRVNYDAGRRAFEGRLVASGGESSGVWVLTYLGTGKSKLKVRRAVQDPEVIRGSVDLTRELTELMREPSVLNDLTKQLGGGAMTGLSVQPPGEVPLLNLRVEAGGQALATSVTHRVCVMMAGPFGKGVPGRSRIGRDGSMRPTFAPGAPGECSDGGGTGRWVEASFGPGRTLLEFIYEGDVADLVPSRGVVQKYRLPERWSKADASCIAVTVHLGAGGWRQKAPEVNVLYAFEGGRCR